MGNVFLKYSEKISIETFINRFQEKYELPLVKVEEVVTVENVKICKLSRVSQVWEKEFGFPGEEIIQQKTIDAIKLYIRDNQNEIENYYNNSLDCHWLTNRFKEENILYSNLILYFKNAFETDKQISRKDIITINNFVSRRFKDLLGRGPNRVFVESFDKNNALYRISGVLPPQFSGFANTSTQNYQMLYDLLKLTLEKIHTELFSGNEMHYRFFLNIDIMQNQLLALVIKANNETKFYKSS